MASADIPDDIPLALLDRYLAGETAGTERATVERWLRGHPGHRRILDAMRGISDVPGGTDLGSDSAAMWQALERRLVVARSAAALAPSRSADCPQASGPATTQRRWPGGAAWNDRRVLPTRRGRLLAARAMILMAIVAAVGIGLVFRRSSISNPRSLTRAVREYATAAGQRLSVRLADGTLLTLAPVSRARLAADYGRGNRVVDLEGEAYFAVVHDTVHPFVVRAHGAVARDVGTAFDVRAYAEDAGARIAVAEGTVAVCADGAASGTGISCSVQVQAGDVATVGDEGIAVKHKADVATLTSWTSGELRLAGVTLRDAVAQLERWYGISIAVRGTPHVEERVVATFRAEPAVGAVGAVALVVGARVEHEGSHFTLVFGQ